MTKKNQPLLWLCCIFKITINLAGANPDPEMDAEFS